MHAGIRAASQGAALFSVVGIAIGIASAQSSAGKASIPNSEARPIFQALQPQLWPAELRTKTAPQIEALWPGWIAREDAAIRARVQAGDEDSIINLLLYGTTFTRQPRISERELAGVVVRQRDTGATTFVPSPVLEGRIEDFIEALASPAGNERMQFARQVIERNGMTPATATGKLRVRTYLQERAAVVGSAVHASTLLDPDAPLVDQVTIFRDRGLSSDTSILIDFGIEQALAAVTSDGLLKPAAVRRVAVIGPGLDFTDKQEGHDFYPQQTIQPFAVIDSLIRLRLAASGGVRVTAFDLSSRVIRHIESARARAREGRPYTLVLPREPDRMWTAELTKYWQRFGDRIGRETTPLAPPPAAGPLEVRAVALPPPVVLSVTPRDLNVVVQRLEPLPADQQFDLIVATNILLYYDVFEQSLAIANVAHMLRPGGIFLTNDRLFELPASPLRPVGSTNVVYLDQPGAAVKGDRVAAYQR
jgi:SAM-dependent methyltransferase